MNGLVTRRNFFRYAGSLAAQAALPLAGCGARPKTPSSLPNFLFILVDDLGYADIGCYGSDLHETPNIDRLAAQGMPFSHAYAAAPVCSPTRASIMTGKYPARLHMTTWYESAANPPQDRALIPPITLGNLPFEQVTIAEVLQAAGYLTAHIGKWHLGDAAHYPETQGFDVNIGGTFWGAPTSFFYPFRGKSRWGGEYRYVPHLEFGRPGDYLTDRLTDEALAVLDKTKGRPFFLNLCYHTVHTPIQGKPELVEKYRQKVRPDMHHQNCDYAAMVHSLDENVGRLLGKLTELDIAEQTIVIFFSDNGGYINQFENHPVTDNYPLRSGKGSLYEGGVRVPLIVRWPGVIQAGRQSAEPVSSIDFYRTFLDISGLAGDSLHNADVDGRSILPLLKNPQARLGREALFWHYPHYYTNTTPVSAIRQGEHKLLHYLEDDRVELYNLNVDPGEKQDLAGRLPDQARILKERLQAWRKEVHAQMPMPRSK